MLGFGTGGSFLQNVVTGFEHKHTHTHTLKHTVAIHAHTRTHTRVIQCGLVE